MHRLQTTTGPGKAERNETHRLVQYILEEDFQKSIPPLIHTGVTYFHSLPTGLLPLLFHMCTPAVAFFEAILTSPLVSLAVPTASDALEHIVGVAPPRRSYCVQFARPMRGSRLRFFPLLEHLGSTAGLDLFWEPTHHYIQLSGDPECTAHLKGAFKTRHTDDWRTVENAPLCKSEFVSQLARCYGKVYTHRNVSIEKAVNNYESREAD